MAIVLGRLHETHLHIPYKCSCSVTETCVPWLSKRDGSEKMADVGWPAGQTSSCRASVTVAVYILCQVLCVNSLALASANVTVRDWCEGSESQISIVPWELTAVFRTMGHVNSLWTKGVSGTLLPSLPVCQDLS